MRGDLRCIDGRLWRHDPQLDDPDLETEIGQCPDCSGDGCGDDNEPVIKAGRSAAWLGQNIEHESLPRQTAKASSEIVCQLTNCLQCGCPLQKGEWDYCGDCSAGQLED